MDAPTPLIPPPPGRAVLIYDGDCGFCRRCVRKIRGWVGDTIEYLAQQEPTCATRFPAIPVADLQASVHLVTADGRVWRGAEAVCTALAVEPRWAWPLRWYRRHRWFAWVLERGYGWVARHRVWVSRVTRPFLPEDGP